jgi:hypothetical protein
LVSVSLVLKIINFDRIAVLILGFDLFRCDFLLIFLNL